MQPTPQMQFTVNPSAMGLILIVFIVCPLILGLVGLCIHRILRGLSVTTSPVQQSAPKRDGGLAWLTGVGIAAAALVGISVVLAFVSSSTNVVAGTGVASVPAIGLLVVPLFLGIVVACVYGVFRGRGGNAAFTVQRSATSWFGELGWLSAPAIVAATFAGISASESPLQSIPETKRSTVQPRPSTLPKPLSPLAITPVPTDDRTRTVSADGLTQRPAWVDQPRTSDGISERIAIASQQFTTREEAEQELSSRAAELLLRDLQQIDPGTSQISSWYPTPEDIKRHAIKQQYVEVVERDFGNFFSPMYRVWWQIELSPAVRTEFLPAWRQGLTSNRIRQVGVVVSAFALAASLMAIYHRRNVQGGRQMMPGVSSTIIAIGSLVLMGIVLLFVIRLKVGADRFSVVHSNPHYSTFSEASKHGWYAFQSRDFDQAVAAWDEAIRLNPNDSEIHRWRGDASLNKYDYDRALSEYDDAIRLDPKNGMAYCSRGAAWTGKGESNKANAAFDEAIRLDPTIADIPFYKRFKKAAESLGTATPSSPQK